MLDVLIALCLLALAFLLRDLHRIEKRQSRLEDLMLVIAHQQSKTIGSLCLLIDAACVDPEKREGYLLQRLQEKFHE